MRAVLIIRPELSASSASRLRVLRAVGTSERPPIEISIGPSTAMSIASGWTRPIVGRPDPACWPMVNTWFIHSP